MKTRIAIASLSLAFAGLFVAPAAVSNAQVAVQIGPAQIGIFRNRFDQGVFHITTNRKIQALRKPDVVRQFRSHSSLQSVEAD